MSDVGETLAPASQPSAFRLYGVVLGVGVICALAIVTVYETTLPIIENNRLASTRRAVFEVLPNASAIEAFLYEESSQTFRQSSADSPDGEIIYAGFDEDGNLVGLAIETQGMGYQDIIRVLYGYSFSEQAVIGVRVLETRETPGLGDRIEKDPVFLQNFERLDVRLNSEASEVENPIQFVKSGEKTDAWQIDGITGATISSRALADMLHDSTVQWMPRLHGHQNDFTISNPEAQ